MTGVALVLVLMIYSAQSFSEKLQRTSSSFMLPRPARLVLLDRDGVVNQDVGSPGVVCLSQLELTPKAAEAIACLKQRGCQVVLVTNQSCVGKGLITRQELDSIHSRLQDMLRDEDKDAILDDIYVCTSVNENNDPRMKPSPGMIVEAMNDARVEPHECIMIGDSLRDLHAAHAGGVFHKILVSTGEFRPSCN
jgi:D-glycero-D-manno-heptose 1,7-bisphosphate phosphatase